MIKLKLLLVIIIKHTDLINIYKICLYSTVFKCFNIKELILNIWNTYINNKFTYLNLIGCNFLYISIFILIVI